MNNNKESKTYSFMGNVAIILFAQIMVKVLGLVYRMVITNIDGFGNTGNGFYNAGFQVYTVLLAISSVGILTSAFGKFLLLKGDIEAPEVFAFINSATTSISAALNLNSTSSSLSI